MTAVRPRQLRLIGGWAGAAALRRTVGSWWLVGIAEARSCGVFQAGCPGAVHANGAVLGHGARVAAQRMRSRA